MGHEHVFHGPRPHAAVRRIRIAELAKGLHRRGAATILHQGTERPFCGVFLDNKKKGVYVCRLCGLPLFASNAKFNFGDRLAELLPAVRPRARVRELRDGSLGMMRTEIRCARCDAHLGHVFDDGPPPTHLRYCLNSISMQFQEDAH